MITLNNQLVSNTIDQFKESAQKLPDDFPEEFIDDVYDNIKSMIQDIKERPKIEIFFSKSECAVNIIVKSYEKTDSVLIRGINGCVIDTPNINNHAWTMENVPGAGMRWDDYLRNPPR